MSAATDAARSGVASVVAALRLEVPPADVEVIAAAVVGLVQVIGGAAQKRATAAGEAAAAAITTAEQAEMAEMDRR